MLKVLLAVLTLVVLVACGRAKFYTPTQNKDQQCVSSQLGSQIHVSCPDGTNYAFAAPVNGVNGTNGVDGSNGSNGLDGVDGVDAQGIRIVDPCGDHAGNPDEVLLIFPDGSVLAWYLNIGLVVLQKNVTYQTTDAQRCVFKIDSNNNLVY